MSKKKTVKKTEEPKKAASNIVEGTDARVLINVYTPGHEPKEFRLSIPNITGAANLLHRSPESIVTELIKGLRAKYGNRVG